MFSFFDKPPSLLQKARTNMNIDRRSPRHSDRHSDLEAGGNYSLQSSDTPSPPGRNPPIVQSDPDHPRRLSKQLSRSRQHSRQQSQSTVLTSDSADSSSLSPSHAQLHLRQSFSPFSSLFCVVQCIILPVMMWQCGVAPLNINPMIGPYPDALNYWGAKNAVLIVDDGEHWRLLTPIFLHAGMLHLAGNVMVQLESGNLWEKEWGSAVWILVYVGSALGSSILSTCLMPDQISVGSSGAVMGLFGAKLAEIVLLCCEKSHTLEERAGAESRRQQACGVTGGVILVMAMSFIPYVDWSAHLGGLLAGFTIGMTCFSFKIRQWIWILLWLVAGVGTTFALFSMALAYMYTVEPKEELRDVCGYYKQYFDDYECQCMLDEAIQWGSWRNNEELL